MRQKGFLEIVGALALLGVLVAAIGGAALLGAGTARVTMHEKRPGGVLIAVPVPVNLVRLGIGFVPHEELAEARARLEPWMPAIRAALADLETMPDGRLIFVETGDETVSISKQGRDLVIDVDTQDERVRVALPVRGVRSIVEQLVGAGAAA